MSAGTLSRMIPARRKTVEFLWIKRDFMEMSQHYRDVRKRMKRPMDFCWWCKYKFEDGDMMGLAAISGKGNKLLCGLCVDSASEVQPDDL